MYQSIYIQYVRMSVQKRVRLFPSVPMHLHPVYSNVHVKCVRLLPCVPRHLHPVYSNVHVKMFSIIALCIKASTSSIFECPRNNVFYYCPVYKGIYTESFVRTLYSNARYSVPFHRLKASDMVVKYWRKLNINY